MSAGLQPVDAVPGVSAPLCIGCKWPDALRRNAPTEPRRAGRRSCKWWENATHGRATSQRGGVNQMAADGPVRDAGLLRARRGGRNDIACWPTSDQKSRSLSSHGNVTYQAPDGSSGNVLSASQRGRDGGGAAAVRLSRSRLEAHLQGVRR
jgi:hypothetical protein